MIKNTAYWKHGFLAVAVTGLASFYFLKLAEHSAVGEWNHYSEKYNNKLLIFNDNTAIYDSYGLGKYGCTWSAKNNTLIVLQCEVPFGNNAFTQVHTFTVTSKSDGLLDNEKMSRIEANKDSPAVAPRINPLPSPQSSGNVTAVPPIAKEDVKRTDESSLVDILNTENKQQTLATTEDTQSDPNEPKEQKPSTLSAYTTAIKNVATLREKYIVKQATKDTVITTEDRIGQEIYSNYLKERDAKNKER